MNIRSGTFAVEDIPEPHAGPGEVRIAVQAAGVCLSDVHFIEGSLKPFALDGDSVTIGHETAGVIDEIGDGVTGLAVGQRVLLQAGERRGGKVLTRGIDYDGGWAEYAVATSQTVVPIPDNLPFQQACFIPDAVSTPWAAITATAQVTPASAVSVWGVGGLGAHGVQLLRLAGAAPIIAVDPLPSARERALALGADLVLDPGQADFTEQVDAATEGRGLRTAFDFAGAAPVREQANNVLGQGGTLVLIGLTDKPLTIENGTDFSYHQHQIRGHYGSTPEHVHELVRLVTGGRVDFSGSVSGTYLLQDAQQAVDDLRNKVGSPIRLILTPTSDAQ